MATSELTLELQRDRSIEPVMGLIITFYGTLMKWLPLIVLNLAISIAISTHLLN
jgi:hypothetical protein